MTDPPDQSYEGRRLRGRRRRGYLGARLADAGHGVNLIAHGDHLDALRSEGLRVESAAADLGPLLGDDGAVVSFRNGVDDECWVAEEVGQDRVLGGMAYLFSTVGGPGVVEHTGGPARFVYGELDGERTDRIEALAGFFARVVARGDPNRKKSSLVIVLAPLVFALGTDEKPRLGLVRGADLLHVPVRAVVAALGAVRLGRRETAVLGARLDDLALLLGVRDDEVRVLVFDLFVAATGADPEAVLGFHHRAAVVAKFHYWLQLSDPGDLNDRVSITSGRHPLWRAPRRVRPAGRRRSRTRRCPSRR